MISYVMDASLLMRQSKELNINPKMFVGGGAGFTLPEFSKNAGKAAEEVFSATLWFQSPALSGGQGLFQQIHKKVRQGHRIPRGRGLCAP